VVHLGCRVVLNHLNRKRPLRYALLFCTLALNSVMYLGLLHMLYSILLLPVAPPGFGTPPPFVRRALFGRNA